MTCVKSREVVLDLYPDVITFRVLPHSWGQFWYDGWNHRGTLGVSEFPEHILRFHGSKDIIIFVANWEDQQFAINISIRKDFPPMLSSEFAIWASRFTTSIAPTWNHVLSLEKGSATAHGSAKIGLLSTRATSSISGLIPSPREFLSRRYSPLQDTSTRPTH
jgi:hypothetical protein